MACLNTYLELRQCRPRIERLKTLLNICPYKGSEYETDEWEEFSRGVGEVGVAEESMPPWSEEEARLKQTKNMVKNVSKKVSVTILLCHFLL